MNRKKAPDIERMYKLLIESVIIESAGASSRLAGCLLTDQEVAVLYKNMFIKKIEDKQQSEDSKLSI
jgi:hypothetical protein